MAITTKSALAAELGITKARVSQYVRRGLPVRSDGRLDRTSALNWLAQHQIGVAGEDKGANRAHEIVRRERQAKSAKPSPTPLPQAAAEPTPFEVGLHLGVSHMMRPHMLAVAWAVLEAGGSLEMAYAAAHLAHSPMVQAAHLMTLREVGHRWFQDEDWDLGFEPGWYAEPDWPALADAAGVPFDPVALRAYLDATPIYSAHGDASEAPCRFERELTAFDVTGTEETAHA
jgi:hypothetical protein